MGSTNASTPSLALTNNSSDPLFLGIDFGTSGCRGVVINRQDELLALCKIEIEAPVVTGEHVTQDPILWRQALLELFASLSKEQGFDQIAALSIDGTSGSVLLCDEDGTPLTQALMYNDASSLQAALRIKDIAPPDSGAHGATSGLAKLIQLSEKFSGSETVYASTQADWLATQCTGSMGVCDANNALKLGYDVIHSCWPQWINELLNPNQVSLPDVVLPGSRIKTVSSEFSRQTGLPESAMVISGTTDSIAATIATGANQIGEAVTSLGSTLVVKLISDKPIFAPQYGVYSHKLGDKWLVGGASNAGCAVLKMFFDQQQLDIMTTKLDPQTSTGLHYYPLLQKGERFPIANPDLTPVLEPRPESDVDFFQAIIEGLTDIEHQAYQKLQQLGAPYPSRIISCGGGSQNPAWTKIRARTLKVPVETAYQSEAAYGSALLAKQGYLN